MTPGTFNVFTEEWSASKKIGDNFGESRSVACTVIVSRRGADFEMCCATP